jgi:hypothetical protein
MTFRFIAFSGEHRAQIESAWYVRTAQPNLSSLQGTRYARR